jgi:hypothetical protein
MLKDAVQEKALVIYDVALSVQMTAPGKPEIVAVPNKGNLH